jgi:hypothetical protein
MAYNSGAMKEAERIRRVVSLWLQRPPDKRTEHDALVFCLELQQNRSDLLVKGHGDPCQRLIADLRGHIHEP